MFFRRIESVFNINEISQVVAMVALVKMIINQHSNRFNSCPDYKDVPPLPNNRDDSLERQANIVGWRNW